MKASSLKWEAKFGGERALLDCGNGWLLSIGRGGFYYVSERMPYEVAVVTEINGDIHLCGVREILGGDVKGFCSWNDVLEIREKVAALPTADGTLGHNKKRH